MKTDSSADKPAFAGLLIELEFNIFFIAILVNN
jgi:hypothetical protein